MLHHRKCVQSVQSSRYIDSVEVMSSFSCCVGRLQAETGVISLNHNYAFYHDASGYFVWLADPGIHSTC